MLQVSDLKSRIGPAVVVVVDDSAAVARAIARYAGQVNTADQWQAVELFLAKNWTELEGRLTVGHHTANLEATMQPRS